MGTLKTIISIMAGGILFSWMFNGFKVPFIGMVLGFLLTRNSAQKNLLKRMEKRFEEHETLLKYLKKTTEQPVAVVESSAREYKEQGSVHQAAEAAKPEILFVPAEIKADDKVEGKTEKKQSAPPTVDPIDRMLTSLWSFFTQGNVVLRVGLLVLFFGVAFLLKYAVERNMLSIELRLLGVALAGIAMLLFGWQLRLKRSGFALLMQGGGIGLLFLDVFAAFKLYHLLPAPLVFAVMVGLVCTSAALALLQDAKSLALFGATGGFLAPVLLSTSSGNHVALFSYYALLNAGILIIAWFKAWRGLNLLGFFFTLGIGSFWGVSSYEPRFFASTEPFLVLFFLMFTLIGVLFAFRQPAQLRGYVDGTLVFG
ncbi:MAG: DUF2339 domain-containing protein, partial [Candidatus Electrothrix sp. GM3_4]|nr:DUF2339 domain-containing protein [Candidatus Electrothrix sp. GM3_4]